MIKLGDYGEDMAKKLITDLSKAKIKYDTRINFKIDHFKTDCLDGKFSELKEVLKDTQKIEQLLNILKSVLDLRPEPDKFKDLFFKEYNPLRENEKSQMAEILSKVSGNFRALDENDKNIVSQIFLKASDDEQSYYEAMSILHRNEIEIGEEIAGRLDDPLIRATRNLKELGLERDHPLVKQTVIISAQKEVGVFIDEFSTILALKGDFDAGFFDRFPAECTKISVLGSLLNELANRPSSGRMSMDEFTEKCAKEFDNSGNLIIADFQEYAADLARILEKNGNVKVKGNSIKWKVQSVL
ncbi:MAG: hypothetical protein PHQ34_14015 [Methanothrix sp.]|nr:hypothetical protein [Methanothrix sp.]